MKFVRFLVVLLVMVNTSVQARTLLVVGDSLSAAYGIDPQQGWVALLAQRLQISHDDITVVNASISGETTQGGLTRLPALLEKYQPQWVLLELAANDGLRGTPLPVIEKNLQHLVERVIAAQAQPVMIGIRLPPNYGPSYTRRFYALFSQIAEHYEIPHVPFLLAGVALKYELMQADGLHPNAQAQPYILENVWPYLQPLLSK